MAHFEMNRGALAYVICQTIVILFFGLFTEFKDGTDPQGGQGTEDRAVELIQNHYPSFQDVHIMIFVGFGFLMCFLKSHNWGSIGYNYLLACWAI